MFDAGWSGVSGRAYGGIGDVKDGVGSNLSETDIKLGTKWGFPMSNTSLSWRSNYRAMLSEEDIAVQTTDRFNEPSTWGLYPGVVVRSRYMLWDRPKT